MRSLVGCFRTFYNLLSSMAFRHNWQWLTQILTLILILISVSNLINLSFFLFRDIEELGRRKVEEHREVTSDVSFLSFSHCKFGPSQYQIQNSKLDIYITILRKEFDVRSIHLWKSVWKIYQKIVDRDVRNIFWHRSAVLLCHPFWVFNFSVSFFYSVLKIVSSAAGLPLSEDDGI